MANDERIATGPAAEPSKHEANPVAIDVEKLADRVYRLMQAEVRLENARGISTGLIRSE